MMGSITPSTRWYRFKQPFTRTASAYISVDTILEVSGRYMSEALYSYLSTQDQTAWDTALCFEIDRKIEDDTEYIRVEQLASTWKFWVTLDELTPVEGL